MLQVIIYGKIQFLEGENNSGIEVGNNSTDVYKQSKATMETSIWGKDSVKVVNGRRSREDY